MIHKIQIALYNAEICRAIYTTNTHASLAWHGHGNKLLWKYVKVTLIGGMLWLPWASGQSQKRCNSADVGVLERSAAAALRAANFHCKREALHFAWPNFAEPGRELKWHLPSRWDPGALPGQLAPIPWTAKQLAS